MRDWTSEIIRSSFSGACQNELDGETSPTGLEATFFLRQPHQCRVSLCLLEGAGGGGRDFVIKGLAVDFVCGFLILLPSDMYKRAILMLNSVSESHVNIRCHS